ncbi:MAG: hypothetical protein IMHGJWDQ_000480 [Candidatus Fervidibacter sp.]
MASHYCELLKASRPQHCGRWAKRDHLWNDRDNIHLCAPNDIVVKSQLEQFAPVQSVGENGFKVAEVLGLRGKKLWRFCNGQTEPFGNDPGSGNILLRPFVALNVNA